MFFITTDTIKLVRHELPLEDAPPYAVLSHTWGYNEIKYQDLAGGKGLPTHKEGHKKLVQACRLAREQGLEYLWCNTYCTDFIDPKEVGQSINSSFQLFRSSTICIAHLVDVDTPSSNAIDSAGQVVTSGLPERLWHSRWFTRSWTLQELITPPRLVFYSRDWKYIGERSELRSLLYDITSIDPYILAGGDLSRIPIARKMFWAANRNATSLEDVAYALHGLFGVHRTPLYGESLEEAFCKLQEEIAKKTEDPSLLAWRDDWLEKYSTWDKCKDILRSPQLRGLLAKSPAYFSHCGRLFPPLGTRIQDEGSRQDQEDSRDTNLDDWDVSRVASFGSSTTLVGSSASAAVNSGLATAVTFFLDAETVYPLLEAVVQKPNIGVNRLRRNLVRLLRELGLELMLEASTKNESLAAVFLRQHRIAIASAVTMRAAEKYLESVPLVSKEDVLSEAPGTSAHEVQGAERDEAFAWHEDDEDSGQRGPVRK
ncbi:ankyrin repeat-containing protein [Colletotrichum musicola]|uniref:Ankyrin repeat-containing protein n=1 Tax=Colletotrichum musicola TaxID=2175873 RepID=A0A8H6KX26_9PEZI|nr:ankyrin repeat-containing protein [Colletotrichum musicola]